MRQVASAIEEIIQVQQVGQGEAIPPERLLATQLGVSRTTVRAAIALLVERNQLYRIPGSGTYVGELARCVTRDNHTPTASRLIALSLLELANPWFVELTRGLQQALRKQDCDCLLNIAHYDLEEEQKFLDRLCRQRLVQGLLVIPLREKYQSLQIYADLRAAGIPFVFVSHHLPGVAADYVVVDSYAGAHAAVSYLIQLGHRHIGYVSCNIPIPGLTMQNREQGYRQALQQHGLAPLPIAQFASLKQDMAAGYRAMDELLALTPRPTAVLAFNDAMALGAFRKAREVGLRIPEDLSIIGIDNTEMAATWEVPLTSVDPSPDVLGRLAVNVLLHRIEHPTEARYQKIALHPNLVVRSSCAPPAISAYYSLPCPEAS